MADGRLPRLLASSRLHTGIAECKHEQAFIEAGASLVVARGRAALVLEQPTRLRAFSRRTSEMLRISSRLPLALTKALRCLALQGALGHVGGSRSQATARLVPSSSAARDRSQAEAEAENIENATPDDFDPWSCSLGQATAGRLLGRGSDKAAERPADRGSSAEAPTTTAYPFPETGPRLEAPTTAAERHPPAMSLGLRLAGRREPAALAGRESHTIFQPHRMLPPIVPRPVSPPLPHAAMHPAPHIAPAPVPVERQRTLSVAVLGAPNSGKSTLVNALCGAKITAVSPKTNTTRAASLGAITCGDVQLLLVDTPGVVDPARAQDAAHGRRVDSAYASAADAGVLLLLVDAARQLELPDPRVMRLVTELGPRLAAAAGPGGKEPEVVLLLNKADAVARDRRPLLPRLAAQLSALYAAGAEDDGRRFSRVCDLSGLHGLGVGELRAWLLEQAPLAPWQLDADESTDRSEADLAVEATREQLFLRLNQELPYVVTVHHVDWSVLGDGSMRFEQAVVVPSQSIRKIVVGARGAVVGATGAAAAEQLERLFGRKVHLVINVTVRSGRDAR